MENTQKTQKSINEELQYLWENRQTLNNEQWNRLALIVCNTLKHIKFYDFEGFTTQEDLIQDFFEKKVYRPDLNSKCYHTGALILFFKNFLKDKLPKKIEYDEKVRSYEVMIENGEKNTDEYSSEDENLDWRTSNNDEKVLNATENNENENIELDTIDYIEDFTGDAKLFIENVKNSAKQWLGKQDFWVKLFLANNSYFNENREALNILAKKYKIPSYHYKAEKLGLVWKFPKDFKKYEKTTMIGQWISTLNIEICEENIKVIVEILKILCLTALSLVDEENI